MNAQIQTQFDRLDAALDTLVDSITTYNPSPAAATTLVQIDKDLTADLDILSTHQRNVTTLTTLRTTTHTLDARIKDTITLLASARKDLLATGPPVPSSPSTQPPKPIDATTLLQTAQRIAAQTRPPKPSYPLPTQAPPRSPSVTPPPGSAAGSRPTTSHSEIEPKPKADIAPTLLEPYELADLDPTIRGADMFVPWPSEERMRAGLLGRLQSVVEGGGDVDVAVEEMAAAGKVAAGIGAEEEEEVRQVNGVADPDVATGRVRSQLSAEEAERRRKEQEERARQQEADLAGFDLYDPDADDE